jgi:hypothetical protein
VAPEAGASDCGDARFSPIRAIDQMLGNVVIKSVCRQILIIGFSLAADQRLISLEKAGGLDTRELVAAESARALPG